ncbi:MAG TPA: hypothetical protein VGO34_13885 [Alphaproteobacteria bacterium]|jgi:hypothetical protein
MAKSRIPSSVLVLLLLALWGAGGAGFAPAARANEGPAEAAKPAAEDWIPTGDAKKGAAEDKGAKDKLRAMFGGDIIEHLPLPVMSVSVIRDNQVTDQVNIAIVVETKGDGNRDKVILERYHLYDAYLRDLYGLLAIKRSDGQLFDQQVVKIRLARVSERLLGPGVVNDILVRGVSQRPLN